MTRKQMEVESRRHYVVDAARKVFAQKGVENTSMEDIARAADYTRRTIYAYFKSHDEICLLVLLEDQAVRWELQKQAISNVEGGIAKLRAWADSLYRFVRTHPHYAHLDSYWDFRGLNAKLISPHLFARFEKQNSELADGLREIFRLGITDGSMRPDLQVDMCISQFLYSLRSIIHRAISPAYSFANFDADDYMRHYVDLFLRSIRNS
ncbi:MAG: TetR/AcrR family transcriptional regulator [Candidatus Zixiibacteriota bacterium]|nr:MAG: TetR/AcrR family transcriptional regulator [candidate division Zixibacteria bacterium]